jgi:hypothetical protein
MTGVRGREVMEEEHRFFWFRAESVSMGEMCSGSVDRKPFVNQLIGPPILARGCGNAGLNSRGSPCHMPRRHNSGRCWPEQIRAGRRVAEVAQAMEVPEAAVYSSVRGELAGTSSSEGEAAGRSPADRARDGAGHE